MLLPHNAHVLVADGRKALFFRNEGDAAHPSLTAVDALEHPSPADRDQKSDAAGRASGTHGAANSAVAEADYHDQEEARFAADLADGLKRRALANEFEALVIVAPPRTLGVLRKHLHGAVADRVTAELAKDLTGHPVDRIEQALADA